jgi:phosphoenolpyruvate synthase/pyruvate phosphate dikinase
MSDMVNSDFNPEIIRNKRIIEGQQAYRKLHQKLNGGKRRQFEQAYEMVKLLIRTRNMTQYLIYLANETVRQRALLEGIRFVEQGRLDAADDIFWLTPDEVDKANADSAIDLRQARAAKLPFYRKLEQYRSLPHLIDSRGRTGKVIQPQSDLNVLKGLGISPGVVTGHVKILKHPRDKQIVKGDVLVAYTTDLGWTQLFFDAAAVILGESGDLQHGGVVAREYGKPCVVGIQNLMDHLHDGQLVEVNGTTGVIRILPDK